MTDIKAAAKLLREGKKVHRITWNKGLYLRETPSGFINDDQGRTANWLMVEDFLAEDWEEFVWVN